MSDKWQQNKRSYMEWVRDYARHFITCPACGAEPTQYCRSERGGDPANFVCPGRWKLAYAEINDPARKREWPRKPRPAVAERPAQPKHTWREFTGKNPSWKARKLRRALAEDGIILRKEGAKYLVVRGGYIIGPLSLEVAVIWALAHHWNTDWCEAAERERIHRERPWLAA